MQFILLSNHMTLNLPTHFIKESIYPISEGFLEQLTYITGLSSRRLHGN